MALNVSLPLPPHLCNAISCGNSLVSGLEGTTTTATKFSSVGCIRQLDTVNGSENVAIEVQLYDIVVEMMVSSKSGEGKEKRDCHW